MNLLPKPILEQGRILKETSRCRSRFPDNIMKTSIISLLISLLLCVIAFAQEAPGPEASAFLNSVASLDKEGRLDDALHRLDQGLQQYTKLDYDRFFILNYKFHLLSKQNRYLDAVPVAVEKANIIQSPKQALVVAKAYLHIGDTGHALEWIRQSVQRGLQSYDIFDDALYEPLRHNDQFAALIDTVKRRNGIGLPAKSFVRQTLSGHEVSLARYRGKVLLIDFWATWCAPCIKQMPHLKKCYDEYRDKGFEIVGFSADTDVTQLKKYLRTNGIAWENVFCPESETDETMLQYRIANIPASVLIDRRGTVRHVNISGIRLETAIAELIDE